MTDLVVKNLSVMAGSSKLVDDVSLSLEQGRLVAILGPNGAGKTTLLRAALGLTATTTGSATIDGEECSQLSPSERAIKVSYLPQRRPLAWPNTVRDIITLGRFAHGAALGRLSPRDAAAVDHAIESCDLEAHANRRADSLSGGELARVHFARALAAKTTLLIADEPVAALDPRHQLRIAELIRSFVDSGGGALVVLHEVALAARFADHLIWMKHGKIVASGSPRDTLSGELMQDVYGVQATVNFDDHGIDLRIQGAS
jgi:iron complex transport system ATP-binding protein